ncbi:MAG: prepilin-type N-terminal cleavage/methylation domain-containing protein [Patescibacteria group bacterium]|nr:prepilin-type N-terminal cleavage/methylation domain-containing protein [Patescibacteria group bacterium]
MKLISKIKRAFSLIEVIIAITIFALVAAGLTMLALGGFDGFNSSTKRSEAANFLNEAVVGSQVLAQTDWSSFIYNSSGIEKNGANWVLKGEGTSDSLNGMSRILKIENLCRNELGLYRDCSGSAVDAHAKKITAEVDWTDNFGRDNKLTKMFIIRDSGLTPAPVCLPVCIDKCSGELDSCGKPTCTNPIGGLAIVSGVTAVANGSTKIDVSWTATSSYSNTTYRLEYSRSDDGVIWGAFSSVSGASALATTTYTHTGISDVYYYKYRVRPTICSSIAGAISSESNSTTCPYTVATPATLTLATSTGRVSASWSAVPGAANYILYGNTNGSNKQLYFGSNRSYADTGLTNNQTYYYSVAAVVCGVTSTKSTQKSAKPLSAYEPACIASTPLGSACGGGWLICKPNDGNCSDSPTKYVVVAPADISTNKWINAVTACNNYSNDSSYYGWSLPKLSIDQYNSSGNFGVNNEICQMMKRSNVCVGMTNATGCSGGCSSGTRPVVGIQSGQPYWSLTQVGPGADNFYSSYWTQSSSFGSQQQLPGRWLNYVRCVRRF